MFGGGCRTLRVVVGWASLQSGPGWLQFGAEPCAELRCSSRARREVEFTVTLKRCTIRSRLERRSSDAAPAPNVPLGKAPQVVRWFSKSSRSALSEEIASVVLAFSAQV